MSHQIPRNSNININSKPVGVSANPGVSGQGQHSTQTQAAQAFERRAKPADRLSTARLDDLLPATNPYFELLNYERQLDENIVQKRMRIADAAFKGPKIRRMLRISVYNLAHDQVDGVGDKVVSAGPYAVFNTEDNDGDLLLSAGAQQKAQKAVPSWTLRIEGKLEAKAGRPSVAANRKFTSFLKSAYIQIGEDDLVEWTRQPNAVESDGFEIKRRGSSPVDVKILLNLENQPEKFKLSYELSTLLNIPNMSSKPHIILALWRYVKLNKLQESDEKKVINCDKALKELFHGAQKCTFSELPSLVDPHLSPLDPIEITYTIGLQPLNTSNYVYEVEVDIDDPSRLSRASISSPTLYNLQMDLDSTTLRQREIADTLRGTLHNKRLLEEFASDPCGFILKTLSQQSDDVSVILGEAKVPVGDLFRSERYKEQDVELAVQDLVSSISESLLFA